MQTEQHLDPRYMRAHTRPSPDRPGLSFVLLLAFLGVLWVSGGASRADAWGQVATRAAAWLLLVVSILFGKPPRLRSAGPVALFLLAGVALALTQLIPLPPDVWTGLPGRGILVDAARLTGEAQPWRPLSIVPGATVNAASALIVPVATLCFMTGLTPSEHQRIPGTLLCLAVASTLIGLLQFSGARFDNPLVNDTPGQVSGLFANRNHFALFTAMGCLIAPVWTFQGRRRPHWRGPASLAFMALFVLAILGSGSRAGIILGVVGIASGMILARRGIGEELNRYPRWVLPASVAGLVAAIVLIVILSIVADRAASIDRAFAIDPGRDMRSRGLPTVFGMIREYFPFGSGLGGFDPIFRIHEPFDVLKPTYFNHAHNDFLETVLDAGLPGLLLLAAALLWWLWASAGAWQAGTGAPLASPGLGSTMLLLILIASAFDYPARTPMIMAVMVIAGVWLGRPEEPHASSLPKTDQSL